jgi:hypothetical protein
MRKRNVRGLILATVGYLLSPLSWWNDAFVNLPLAYLAALPFGLIWRPLFMPAMIVAYWGTNVLGFVLLHHGTVEAFGRSPHKPSLRMEMRRCLRLSTLYTLLIVALWACGILRVPAG